MRSKHLYGLILPLVLINFLVTNAKAETLRGVVQRTVQTNPDILSAQKKKQGADAGVRVAKGGFLPKLDLSAGIGREESRNETTRSLPNRTRITLRRQEGSLIGSQELFTGFATIHEVARTKAVSKSNAFLVKTTAEDIALDTVRAYVDVLRRQALVSMAERNLGEHRRIYDMIHSRTESGISKEADEVQAGARLALAQANLASEQGNLREARFVYQRIVGNMPNRLVSPRFPKGVLPRTKQDAVEMAVRNHPTLKSANADIDAARAQHKETKATNYPHFVAQLGANRSTNLDGVEGTNYSNFGMVRVSYNLYNGGSDVARQRQTAYGVQEAAKIRDHTYRQVRENMGLAWTAMEVNRRLMTFYARHRDESWKTYEAYRDQFKLGQRSLLDTLDAENEYYTSSVAYINAKMDEVISKFRVLNGMGRTLHAFGVPLPRHARS